MSITYKDKSGIEGMRLAGRLASEVLDFLAPHVQVGVTTNQLDQLAHDYITQVQHAIPAPLNYAPSGYKPYPKSICTSINHQVCHGIPSDKALKRGDIINIDITVIKDGWHGDTSRMFAVGEASIAAKRAAAAAAALLRFGTALSKSSRGPGWVTLALRSSALQRGTAFPWCVSFAATALVKNFMKTLKCCTTANPGPWRSCKPA